MAKLAILIFVCCASPILFGQSKNTQMDDVNSILDDLDRRLTDQENQVLTFDEQRLLDSEAEDKGQEVHTLNFKPKSITASRNVDEELMRLSNTVLDLDKRIEELDSRVQLSKQKILEGSKLDNLISITGELEASHAQSLRSLIVKLDGYTIYEINENNGLWLPSKQIPFYSGPLPPGAHTVEVNGRIVRKSSLEAPINASDFTSISFIKEVHVEDGESRQQINIALKPEIN